MDPEQDPGQRPEGRLKVVSDDIPTDVTERCLVANIIARGCVEVATKSRTARKFASPSSSKKFFVPKPLTGDGYTTRQLNRLEHLLSRVGVDLLPLDRNLGV